MRKIIIHCPINCEEFCAREIESKIPLSLKHEYKLKVSERGTLYLELFSQTKDVFSQWQELLSKCVTIEKLKLELELRDLERKIQYSKIRKSDQANFLEKCFENAITQLFQISSPSSVKIFSNTQYWKDFSQQEIQGIFKRVATNHNPPLNLVLKKNVTSKLRISLTKQNLRITLDLPVQKSFSLLRLHPTPTFPSVAYVMVQFAMQQVPKATQVIDAMCGAGTLAFMAVKILKGSTSSLCTVGGFDVDVRWIEAAKENAVNFSAPNVHFYVYDLLEGDFDSFPFRNCEVILAHPPYGHFVHYRDDVLRQLYSNLLQLYLRFGCEKSCLVINSPRDDILTPLIEKSPVKLVKILDIPRKITTIKIWVIIKKGKA